MPAVEFKEPSSPAPAGAATPMPEVRRRTPAQWRWILGGMGLVLLANLLLGALWAVLCIPIYRAECEFRTLTLDEAKRTMSPPPGFPWPEEDCGKSPAQILAEWNDPRLQERTRAVLAPLWKNALPNPMTKVKIRQMPTAPYLIRVQVDAARPEYSLEFLKEFLHQDQEARREAALQAGESRIRSLFMNKGRLGQLTQKCTDILAFQRKHAASCPEARARLPESDQRLAESMFAEEMKLFELNKNAPLLNRAFTTGFGKKNETTGTSPVMPAWEGIIRPWPCAKHLTAEEAAAYDGMIGGATRLYSQYQGAQETLAREWKKGRSPYFHMMVPPHTYPQAVFPNRPLIMVVSLLAGLVVSIPVGAGLGLAGWYLFGRRGTAAAPPHRP